MITIEEKLNIFSKLVFEKEQNKSDEKLDDMYKRNEEITQQHKKELENKAQEIIKRKIKEGERKKNEIISKANIEVRNKLLNKKQELLKDMIEEMENRARKFINTKEYESYQISNLMDAFSALDLNGKIQIYLTVKDMDIFSEKIKKIVLNQGFQKQNIELTSTNKDIIGGAIIVDHEKGIRVDTTLKTLIEDNKDYIGRKVYECLEKAGDSSE